MNLTSLQRVFENVFDYEQLIQYTVHEVLISNNYLTKVNANKYFVVNTLLFLFAAKCLDHKNGYKCFSPSKRIYCLQYKKTFKGNKAVR